MKNEFDYSTGLQVTHPNLKGAELTLTQVDKTPYGGLNSPATLASLTRASQRYFQTRSNYHLQSAVQMLTRRDRCSLREYDEMYQTEPIIAQAIDACFMASANSELRPSVPETTLASNNLRAAENAVAFIENAYAYMDDDYYESLQKMHLDTLLYGEGMCELMWGDGYGELAGRRVVRRIDSFELEQAITLIDTGNRIVGYAPYGIPGIFAPMGTWLPIQDLASQLLEIFESADREHALYNFKIIPKWKVLHQRWMPASDPHKVIRLLEPGKQMWWAKQQALAILMALIDEAQGVKFGTTAQGAQEVCLFDAGGNEVTCTPEAALLQQISKGWGGGTVTGVFGTGVGHIQPKPEMITAVISAIDLFSQEISTAVAKQFLATSQGARGSEMGAKAHKELFSMLVAHSQNRQAMCLYTQLHKPQIVANFGVDAAPFTPEVDMSLPNGLARTPDEIGLLNQSRYFSPDQMPSIDRQLGFQPRRRPGMTLSNVELSETQGIMGTIAERLRREGSLTLRYEE
jgi:hypothetical protein